MTFAELKKSVKSVIVVEFYLSADLDGSDGSVLWLSIEVWMVSGLVKTFGIRNYRLRSNDSVDKNMVNSEALFQKANQKWATRLW